MFEMREPADAVLYGVSDAAPGLDSADQRLEAWFNPFGGVAHPVAWTTATSRRRPRRRSADASARTLDHLHGNHFSNLLRSAFLPATALFHAPGGQLPSRPMRGGNRRVLRVNSESNPA